MRATIIIAGILELLGALFFLLLALIVVISPSLGKQATAISPAGTWEIAAILAMIGATYVTTAIGLFCRKDWARTLTLITGVGISLYALFSSGIGVYAVLSNPSISPSSRSAVIGLALGFMSPLLAIGLWWTWAFRRSKMIGHFPMPTSPRPTSISLIAASAFIAPLALPTVFYVKAFPFMGVLLEGVPAQFCLAVWIVAWFVMGIGLWRLQEWARIGTLILLVFGLLNSALLLPVPGLYEQYMATALSQVDIAVQQSPRIKWFMIVWSVLFCGIFSYFLITRRAAFKKPMG